MAATTYTGTGGNQTISNAVNGVSFQPDFAWLKDRTASGNHQLFNNVVGAGTALASNLTNAEFGSGGLNAFNSNGFSGNIGSTNNYVAWQWKASNSAAVTNTSGSITSQVSANTTAGFSVVTFTGNGTAGATIGHGLGVAPKLIFVKSRSAVGDWWVYNASIGATKVLFLSLIDAALTFAAWNNTAPTSNVFTIGLASGLNANGVTQVAYCFAEVAGYSAFGSYTGNASTDGPFVYLGFRPRFILTKRSDSTSPWQILDSSRDTFNSSIKALFPNTTGAEASFTQPNGIDFLSNGFKLRNSSTDDNASGGTYIYAAFAENPFKYANAR
jgi:hypothetical protein